MRIRRLAAVALSLVLLAAATSPALAAPRAAYRTAESKYFTVQYTDRDAERVEPLLTGLDKVYSEVTALVGRKPPAKVQLTLHPTLESVYGAVGATVPDRAKEEDWDYAFAANSTIHSYSPLSYSMEKVLWGLAHEFTHTVVEQFHRFQPSYLNEGLAVYVPIYLYGDQMPDELRYRVALYIARHQDQLLSVSELEKLTYDPNVPSPEDPMYMLGAAYIHFIVDSFGSDALTALLEGKSKRQATGLSDTELNEKWFAYIDPIKKVGSTASFDLYAMDDGDADVAAQIVQPLDEMRRRVLTDFDGIDIPKASLTLYRESPVIFVQDLVPATSDTAQFLVRDDGSIDVRVPVSQTETDMLISQIPEAYAAHLSQFIASHIDDLVLHSVDTGSTQFSAQVMNTSDACVLSRIIEMLSATQERILTDFALSAPDSSRITLYRHSAVPFLEELEYADESFSPIQENGDIIAVLPEDEPDLERYLQKIQYAYSGYLLKASHFSPFECRWLWNGILLYECDLPTDISAIAEDLQYGTVPRFLDLAGQYWNMEHRDEYNKAGADFIISTFGFDKIEPILRGESAMSVLQLGNADLNDTWLSYLKQEYSSGPQQMGSSEYILEGGRLTGIAIGTPAADLISTIGDALSAEAEIQDADGNAVQPDDLTATGMQLVLSDADGGAAVMKIIVQGDVLGTGTMSLTQLVALCGAFTGSRDLGAYEVAGDWSGNGTIDLTDIVQEARLLLDAQ